jgi:predicted CxxxxCH...CXXCH cytochrome family protein
VSAGYDCTACHIKPTPGQTNHPSGQLNITWGSLATGNGATSPAYDTSTNRCSSVYCHGSFTGGNSANAPIWTGADATQGACGTCHGDPAGTAAPRTSHVALAAGSTNATCAACHPDTVDASGAILPGGKHVNGEFNFDPAAKHPAGWTDPSSDAFHGVTAAKGAEGCKRCHAVRQPAAVTNVTCADCHLGGQSWTTTCNGCHGQAGDPRGAPPADVRGRTATTEIGVGAHRLHVDPNGVSEPLDCVFCHRKPSDVYDPGHLDGAVTVSAYTGTDAAWIAAERDPSWNPATATCATAYCHSAYAPGNAPVWTAPRANACGTCHGLPPVGGRHPAVSSDLTGCNTCHPDSITAAGVLVPPPAGKHLDGHVSVSGGHVAGWIDPASPEFHAYSADRGLAQCQICHGTDLGGGFAGVACAGCHDQNLPPWASSWKTNCVMCHGGVANSTGAPPKAIWGYDADPVRVGAHTAHVQGGPLAAPIACETCHVTPPDALAPGHIDEVTGPTRPMATVTFSGVAVDSSVTATWDRPSRSCAVYCHGASFDATVVGSHTTPDWTGGPAEAACGSCHGVPPGGTHPRRTDCGSCHPGYGPSSVNPATHVNGSLETSFDCSSCHGDRTRPATPVNPQIAAAPPLGIDGESATTARSVGAHQLHVAPGPLTAGIACGECHPPVTSTAATGTHRNGVADLSWGPLASTSIDPATIQWSGTTCSATYCHGNFPFGNLGNAPTWTAPVANPCGTCHGTPPGGVHPTNAQCGSCHPGYTSTTVDPVAHVNGKLDVRTDCDGCHGDHTRTPVVPICGTGVCTDPNVRGAPPVTATGRPAGAHLAHVNPATLHMSPIRCAECHQGAIPPASPTHMDGTPDVHFSGRATLGGVAPSYDGASCSATYCHGNYSGNFVYSYWDWGVDQLATTSVPYSGGHATPGWADGPTTCASCHGAPPSGYWHSPNHGYPAQPYQRECQTCHPDATSTGGVPTGITNPALHVNGQIDVTPLWDTSCTNCH